MNKSNEKENLEIELNQRIEELIDFYYMSDELREQEESFPLYDQLNNLDFRYGIKELVNQGGGKLVYKAEDLHSGREVALARMFDEDAEELEKKEAFLREARLTAALQHPNIMPVYDVGLDENKIPFFTMKLVRNLTLSDILKKVRQNPAYRKIYNRQFLLDVFVKICEAVAYAHSKGVLHLDLKPENILIGTFGDVLVADWGLGKVVCEPLKDSELASGQEFDSLIMSDITQYGVVKGTIGYMAPEQLDKQLGPKSKLTDIFSLGALLYAILTTKRPIEAESLQEYRRKLFSKKILPPSVCSKCANIPESLDAVCLKAMQIKPNNRYQQVTELIKDINAYQSGFATKAEEAGFFKALLLICKRHKYLMFFMLFLAMTIVVVSVQNLKVKKAEKVAGEEKERLRLAKQETKQFFTFTVMSNVEKIYSEFVKNSHETNWDLIRYLEKIAGSNETLNELRSKLLFVENRFEESLQTGGFKPKKFDDLAKLAEKYGDRTTPGKILPVQISLGLCRELYKSGRVPLTYQYMSYWLDKYNNKDAEQLLKAVLKLFNKEIGKEINLKLKRKKAGYSLDISGNSSLDSLEPLILLPIVELNLHGTKVLKADNLACLPLQRVRMNGRIMSDWRPLLEIESLREIIVTQADMERKFLYKFREKGVRITIK